MATLEIKKELPKWKRVVNNKLRGAYGQTDYKKREIQVNKKLHKKDGEKIIETIVHEELHRKHPKMKERTVRKLEKKHAKKLTKKQRAKHYRNFQK